MQLSERIPSTAKLYFDNYFSSFWLFEWLRKKKIYASGTIRQDRFINPPFLNDKEIKKEQGRGFMENVISKTSGVVLTKWYNNSSVLLGSNYEGIGENVGTCQRWDKTKKQFTQVPRPEVVKHYNEGMGGVDKFDFFISIYRIFLKSKKWTLRMITHGLDLAVTNSWLEYKKKAEQLGLPSNKTLDLIHFRLHVAEVLILAEKTPMKKRGRPSSSSRESPLPNPKTPKREVQLRPIVDVRYDRMDHLPLFQDVKEAGRCKNLGCKAKTYIACNKCKVNLCITRKNNCFESFHTK
ncbi:hypothetical protein C0J52_23332 [Blattella germanica]|nr:hypothetical protein C0J52_23332 [Blattella germanica]